MSWSHTYNITKSLAAFPCAQPDPIIMVETLLPALAPALLEWAGFGCRDILKFRLGIGSPCGRAMKAQVAKAIPPKLVNVVQNILKFEHTFSYAGQMFLLADLASDFVARWSTLAYQLSGCPDAQDVAAWQVEFLTPQLLPANTPVPIQGTVINETGRPGVAWPSGAIVPSDWYYMGEFSVEAEGIFDRTPAGLTTWIERLFPLRYDFPANQYAGGYPFIRQIAHYYLPEQHNGSHGAEQYVYMVKSDRDALTTSFSATGQASGIPIANWTLSPLSCIKNLLAVKLENPAGRNPPTRQPLIKNPFGGPLLPAPVRGPPGAKPRGRK